MSATPVEAPYRYRLGRRLEEYVRLMRLDRPIGVWLLLWPTLWALWVAGNGHPDPQIAPGVRARRDGHALGRLHHQRFADRNVDPHVRRTRERPLAARRVTPTEALVLFVALLGVALSLATFLNAFTLRLACVGAALTVSYPFLKRFFALPQLYLALAFSWGVPMAFAALLGALPRVAWVMFVTTIIWVTDLRHALRDGGSRG